jgi:hypothetical protein
VVWRHVRLGGPWADQGLPYSRTRSRVHDANMMRMQLNLPNLKRSMAVSASLQILGDFHEVIMTLWQPDISLY